MSTAEKMSNPDAFFALIWQTHHTSEVPSVSVIEALMSRMNVATPQTIIKSMRYPEKPPSYIPPSPLPPKPTEPQKPNIVPLRYPAKGATPERPQLRTPPEKYPC